MSEYDPRGRTLFFTDIRCRKCRGNGRIWEPDYMAKKSDVYYCIDCDACTATGRDPIPFEEVWGL